MCLGATQLWVGMNRSFTDRPAIQLKWYIPIKFKYISLDLRFWFLVVAAPPSSSLQGGLGENKMTQILVLTRLITFLPLIYQTADSWFDLAC